MLTAISPFAALAIMLATMEGFVRLFDSKMLRRIPFPITYLLFLFVLFGFGYLMD
jgi:hypothetical protein